MHRKFIKIKAVKDKGRESKEASDDTINLRIITLESRMNELEQRVMLLEKGKEKLEESRMESVRKKKNGGFTDHQPKKKN